MTEFLLFLSVLAIGGVAALVLLVLAGSDDVGRRT